MPQPKLLKIFRLTHLYFGVFISPALLFFALTGALQTFGLHETNRDHPNYKPAHWVQVLAQIHKKQVAALPVRRPQPMTPSATPPAPGSAEVAKATAPESAHLRLHADHPGNAASPPNQPTPAAPAANPEPHRANPLPLRIFFLIVCLGLFSSTGTGLYMAYVYQRSQKLVTLALVAGVVIPILLLLV